MQPADTFFGATQTPDIEFTPNGLIHLVWVGQYPGLIIYHVFHQSSSDGGRHWSGRHQVFNSDWYDTCHPSITSKGDTLFVAFWKIEGLHVFRSFDSGVSWQDSTVADTEFYSLSPPTILYSQGRLHLIYELDIAPYEGNVYYSRSDDLGLTWTARINLSDYGPFPHYTYNPSAFADDQGHIMVVWQDYRFHSSCDWNETSILGRISADNGDSWNSITWLPYTTYFQTPNCLIYADTIFVACPYGSRFGRYNDKISLSYSSDWGSSWSQPEYVTGSRRIDEFGPFLFYTIDRESIYLHCLFCVGEEPDDYGVYYIRNKAFYDDRKPIPDPQPVILKVAAYPNVFNSSTIIFFENSRGGDVELEILDVNGRNIWSKGVSGKEGSIVWEAKDKTGAKVCSGVYFVRVRTTATEKTVKLVYLK